MSKKEEYIIKNKEYIKAKASEEGYNGLPGGVLYKIIEQGNHEELLEKKGRYYQLYTGNAVLA